MSADAADRLARLISLVPWLVNHPGVSVAEAASRFEVSEEELNRDLNLLFLSGRPGHMPDDLIDVVREDDRIYIGNADEIAVPVRLTQDEASSLLVALRALRGSVPADEQRRALDSAEEKLRRAADEGAAPAIDVELPPADPETHGALVQAIEREEALEIDYHVAARDEMTRRVIAPQRLLIAEGVWYVDAWCHTASADRRFRLDAIHALRPAGDLPVPTGPARPSAGLLPGAKRSSRTVTLVLAADRVYLAERVPARSRSYADDGTVEIELTIVEPEWLHRFLMQHGDAVLSVSPPEAAADALARVRASRAAMNRGRTMRGQEQPAEENR